MSLPRDLKVEIPGHGTDKLNAAYELGGPQLTLKTVKQLTGLRINHVINIDFRGFSPAVNAIGCVYVDVDRRYFNNSAELTPTSTCPPATSGCAAATRSQYVRYPPRGQRPRALRAPAGLPAPGQAAGRRRQTDRGPLRSSEDLRQVHARRTSATAPRCCGILKLAVGSIDQPIREVHFEGQIGASYVTASSRSVRKLADQFLGVEETPGPRGKLKPKGRERKPSARSGGGNNLEDAPARGPRPGPAGGAAGPRQEPSRSTTRPSA